MRDYIEKACDEIDAALFSGDAFIDFNHRDELRRYMIRWEEKLKEWEENESPATPRQSQTVGALASNKPQDEINCPECGGAGFIKGKMSSTKYHCYKCFGMGKLSPSKPQPPRGVTCHDCNGCISHAITGVFCCVRMGGKCKLSPIK